ncbi:hypothetical protein CKA32_004268 [Geitlerinema sp. FC II]|nr:hypothetical protein CKA32_004268 [Geitlerinema sp. FC II]
MLLFDGVCRSDIDLAVAGLEFPKFMRLFAEAEELTRFSLDLLRWEEVDPSFQRVILAKGVVLYSYERYFPEKNLPSMLAE